MQLLCVATNAHENSNDHEKVSLGSFLAAFRAES
jgi:hypothetical protein